MTRNVQISALIIALVLGLSLPMFWNRMAPDLSAAWVAALFFADGRLGELYPAAEGIFTITAPEGWAVVAANAAALGRDACSADQSDQPSDLSECHADP